MNLRLMKINWSRIWAMWENFLIYFTRMESMKRVVCSSSNFQADSAKQDEEVNSFTKENLSTAHI